MPEMPQSFMRQTARNQSRCIHKALQFFMQKDLKLQEKKTILVTFLLSLPNPLPPRAEKGRKDCEPVKYLGGNRPTTGTDQLPPRSSKE